VPSLACNRYSLPPSKEWPGCPKLHSSANLAKEWGPDYPALSFRAIPACGPFYLVTRINLAGTAEDLRKWKKVGVLSFESGADMGFSRRSSRSVVFPLPGLRRYDFCRPLFVLAAAYVRSLGNHQIFLIGTGTHEAAATGTHGFD
jgi:hypothetical protein